MLEKKNYETSTAESGTEEDSDDEENGILGRVKMVRKLVL